MDGLLKPDEKTSVARGGEQVAQRGDPAGTTTQKTGS
jgi:hypothetical protein